MEATRILVVEDERIVAFDLLHRLRKLGYRADGFCTTAAEAVERAAAERPDLVLMDIHLEGEADGISAARSLYEQTRIPVIFLTAYADPDTLTRAQTALPFGYLLKPCQTSELNAAIRMALARREAEVRLERNEERQRLALDAAQMGVWEWSPHESVLNVSGHFVDIVGEHAAHALGSWADFLTIVHPDDRDPLLAALQRAQDNHGSFDSTFRVLHSDGGDPVWVETHARAFATPARTIGIIRDVTERRQIELQLKQASAVFDATAEGIFIVDEHGLIVSINPAFTRLTGHDAAGALGQPADTLLQITRNDPLPAPAPASHRQGEAQYRRKSGEYFPVWETLTPVRGGTASAAHTIGMFSDLGALQRAEAELHHLAHYDPLTGLPNRLLFTDRLNQVLERSRRNDGSFALLFLDLDNFKVINDTLGHASGDLLLRTLTARMRGLLRRSDTLARLGGDEFVMLLENLDQPEDAAAIACKLLERLNQPVDLSIDQISISASVGLSLYPNDGRDAETLLKAADTAMYQAKARGRNGYCFHTAQMASLAVERMDLEQGLRRALPNGELVLHFQPQVDLGNGNVQGFEALLRWQRPGNGLIMPDRFIPIAEEAGLIEVLGGWVLDQACIQAAQWREQGWFGRIAVNVSPRQFASGRFVDAVATALQHSGLPPDTLEIEITESCLLSLEHNRDAIDQLKRLGVQIAIDDFGTGYSSLSMLKHFPVDRLKIDRAFIRDLPASPDDTAIVGAICAMARTLGLSLTAEGVETAAQSALLARLGCQIGQGYWFGRPRPADALAPLLSGMVRHVSSA